MEGDIELAEALAELVLNAEVEAGPALVASLAVDAAELELADTCPVI